MLFLVPIQRARHLDNREYRRLAQRPIQVRDQVFDSLNTH